MAWGRTRTTSSFCVETVLNILVIMGIWRCVIYIHLNGIVEGVLHRWQHSLNSTICFYIRLYLFLSSSFHDLTFFFFFIGKVLSFSTPGEKTIVGNDNSSACCHFASASYSVILSLPQVGMFLVCENYRPDSRSQEKAYCGKCHVITKRK